MSNITYNFTNQNFVVTGASSGMGKQVVVELAEAGASVLAIARGEDALRSLQKLYPEKIVIAAVDVCDSEKLKESINSFVKSKGKLDGVVHAAGISGLTPIKSYDEAEARKIVDISFWAGAKLVQICSKVKFSNSGASFVLFSSVRSQKTDKGLFAYAGAKSAMQIAVKTFAKELAKRKLRVNTISPGWVNTNMTDKLEETNNLDEINQNHILGIGKPEDVSGVVLFMLSDRSTWMTGTDIVVDGGYLT